MAYKQHKNEPGTGKIGLVPRLAVGTENLMWGIEATIEKIAKRGAEALKATEPKKTKIISKDGILKRVEEDESIG